MRAEYDKGVFCLVEFQKGCVCAPKQSTFMGSNSLLFMILHPKWTSHFISYTDFEHTIRHEKCTKRYENLQTLS